mmetsp:Transcript_118419/g.330318  ORF Transcript_118419/g.330318 Transcript_118419/m.330318 type:complete len:245 (-) Transcript_118419:300-1034(-)
MAPTSITMGSACTHLHTPMALPTPSCSLSVLLLPHRSHPQPSSGTDRIRTSRHRVPTKRGKPQPSGPSIGSSTKADAQVVGNAAAMPEWSPPEEPPLSEADPSLPKKQGRSMGSLRSLIACIKGCGKYRSVGCMPLLEESIRCTKGSVRVQRAGPAELAPRASGPTVSRWALSSSTRRCRCRSTSRISGRAMLNETAGPVTGVSARCGPPQGSAKLGGTGCKFESSKDRTCTLVPRSSMADPRA